MAEVALLPSGRSSLDRSQDAMGADVYPGASRVAAPAPNPNFSFPMLPPAESLQSSDYPEPEGSGIRGGFHRSRPSNISINPMLTFGMPEQSGGNTPASLGTSEPSPTRAMPMRGAGHRRGGSEFIGGDGAAIGPGLMSTSPTKGDGILPSPPTSGRRRGHAHRRSGAVSTHDLSAMLKPSNNSASLRAGSAPNSPADPDAHKQFIPSLDHSASQPTLRTGISLDTPVAQSPAEELTPAETTPTASPKLSPQESPARSSSRSSPSGQSRPRVGFSDTLEFIPRPLSTISSETSSSLATVRPPHSVTGSITSVISNNTSSPPSAKKQYHTAEILREYRADEQRPKTADSPLARSPLGSPFVRQKTPPQRPSSAGAGKVLREAQSGTEESNPFDERPFGITVPPTGLHTNLEHPIASPQFQADLRRLRGIHDHRDTDYSQRPRSSPEAKVTKKHKKVKTWAGSFLSRKPKTKSTESLDDSNTLDHEPVSHSAKLQEFAPMEEFSLDDVDFDDDTTCVIRSPDYQPPSSARSANAATWISSSSDRDVEAPGAVLDLDATWRALDDQSKTSKRRTMHSSGSTGGFVGPGMHYHRRAESAPALTPVTEAAGFQRMGTNGAMADVFEEEEEEEGHSKGAKSKSHSTRPSEDERDLLGLGVKIVDTQQDHGGPFTRPIRQRSQSSGDEKIRSEFGASETIESVSLADTQQSQELSDVPIEIVDAVEEPRFSVVTKSSDESTITPTFSEHATTTLPTALDFADLRPQQLDTPTTYSYNTSPDVHCASFDAPRLHTATSSMTDRSTLSSARTPEFPIAPSYSTEDVPSLTSSASTMISGHPPQLSPAFPCPRPSGERSFSFSGVTPRQSRPVTPGKRSSLASLSRLVGSSYGEKSKLSVESFAHDGKEKFEKKRHRISRLMRFWKSKEKLTVDE